MKKVIITGLIVIAISVLGINVSHAIILDFDDLETPGTTYTYITSYSSSGFNLTSDYMPSFGYGHQGSPWYFGSPNLWNAFSTGETTLNSSGDLFTINSIDLHLLNAGTGPVTVDFYAYDIGDNQVGHNYLTWNDFTWHIFNFDSNFQDIASIKWQQIPPYHSFDNIVLNESDTIIPEPSTMLLFGFSLLGAGLFKRKRNGI